MGKTNAGNERLKHEYLRYQREARGKSEATLDAMLKAINRFEEYTGHRDFKTFRREQAIAFKERLADTETARGGALLSHSVQASTLAALKEFFGWLAYRPGFKSRIHVPDIEYFSPTRADAARAKAVKLRDFPSLDQVRTAIAAMPGETVFDRRDRALMALAILSGIRVQAMISLALRHVDVTKDPILIRQEPDAVATKFAKVINTYLLPLGDDLTAIVTAWVAELRTEHRFGPTDPLFPRTRIEAGADGAFRPAGIDRRPWQNASPVREIFRTAFIRVGLPYFSPHAFRHTLGHLMQEVCRTPEEMKAWSQNLGHEHIGTTLSSYGRIDPYRQGAVLAGISLDREKPNADIIAELQKLINNARPASAAG